MNSNAPTESNATTIDTAVNNLYTAITNLLNVTAQAQNELSSSQIPTVYTVNDLISILSISRPAAYNLVNLPGFPSFRIGKSIRINAEKFHKWLDDQNAEAGWKGAN